MYNWAKELARSNRDRAKEAKELLRRQAILARPPKVVRLTQFQIWENTMVAVGATFPDGEPIDQMYSWMQEHNVTMEQVDKSVNRYERVKHGLSGYMKEMWDGAQSDAMADAKIVARDGSPFYDIADGVIIPRINPY